MSDLVFIVILILILFLKFVNSYFVHKMTDIFSKRNIYIHKLLYRHLLYLVGFFSSDVDPDSFRSVDPEV